MKPLQQLQSGARHGVYRTHRVAVAEGDLLIARLAGESEALLLLRNPFLGVNLRLHAGDGVGLRHVEGKGLAAERRYVDRNAPAVPASRRRPLPGDRDRPALAVPRQLPARGARACAPRARAPEWFFLF